MNDDVAAVMPQPKWPSATGDPVTTAVICPACGYPTLEPSLCFYCRPMVAL